MCFHVIWYLIVNFNELNSSSMILKIDLRWDMLICLFYTGLVQIEQLLKAYYTKGRGVFYNNKINVDSL